MISFAANSAARETPSVTDVLGGLRLEVKPHRGKSSDTSSFLNLLQQTFLLLYNNHFKEITMFDQFQQHFQNWFNTETVEPAKSTFSLSS